MTVPFVDLARQNLKLDGAIHAALGRVLKSGRYLMGPEVAELEAKMALWHGLAFGVGTASGTDACEVAIRAAGWGDGQTVATPAFAAVPTITAIDAAGATPVLVDVDPLTRGVSRATMEAVKTDGAIVIHMHGHPCYVPPGAIEDCAHAQGARFADGSLVGTRGRAGAISFFPTKCLGHIGDGGMIVTNDELFAERARKIRHYGGLFDGDVTMRGQNSRISELDAAIVAIKLECLHAWNDRRRDIAARYTEELRGKVTVPYEAPGVEPSYHVYAVEYDERDRLQTALAERGVSCMVHYSHALHEYTRWKSLGQPGQFPVSERLARTVLSLPMFPELTEQEQDEVIRAVKDCT